VKSWWKFASSTLISSILALGPGRVLAQDGEGSIPVFRDVLLDVATRIDAKLSTWVTGNTLTDPEGEEFVNDLVDFICDAVAYIAACLEDILVWLDFT